MEEITKEVENKGIERVIEEVKEVEAKPKKPRSQAQKEAFEKARKKRAENLAKKKEEEELEEWAESEVDKELPKVVEDIKPPPKKRGRPRKILKRKEEPAPQYISPPDPQLATGYSYQPSGFGNGMPVFNPYQYYQPPPQQQPVNNYYYYGAPPPQHNNIADPPPAEAIPHLEPEPSPEGSINSDYDYQEEVMMPQNQLKYRFA